MKIFWYRFNQKGSGLFAVLGFLFFLATVLFFVFFLMQPKSPTEKSARTALQDARIEKLQGEMSQLFITLGDVERMRDRRRYMEVTEAASQKLAEADDLWEQRMKTQKGLADGMMGGMNENYESHFTRADKFQMLSEKYGLPAKKLRSLKGDFEIMFADELADKFSPAPEIPAEETKTKETQDRSKT